MILLAAGGLSWAQEGSISGVVKDETNEPLPSAGVRVEGTQQGALTDLEGNYTIAGLPEGEVTLIFTYTGYLPMSRKVKVKAGEASKLNVLLEPETITTEEVIIVGYGTQRKRDMTGNISKISSRDLNDIPGTSIDASLQGKAAGVQVIQGSGIAGSGAIVRVRGIGSLSAGGDPLYVVDGIPITQDPFLNGSRGGQNNNPLSSINPDDIESIEILKDAAATGIYGSRGANGVVLITTKRGKKGKPTFKYNGRVSTSQPTKVYDMLNAEEWLQLNQEAWENDGGTGRAPLPQGLSYADIEGVDTDWVDETLRLGIKHEHNLGFTQGNDKLQTYIGASYMDSESYLKDNSYERITGRVNLDYSPIDKLKFSLNTSLARGRNNRIGQAWDGSLGQALSTALPIYDAENTVNQITQQQYRDWRTIETRNITNGSVEFKPMNNLRFNVTGNLDLMDLGDNIYEDSLWDTQGNIPRAKEWQTNVLNYSGNATVNYDFTFLPDDHVLSLLGGSEIQKSTTESSYMELSNVTRHIYLNPESSDITDTISTDNPTQAWSFASFFARANYKYKDRYLFQASARVDGSSRFGVNNRYGFFPTVAGGWIISEENFFQGAKGVVNFLKLKSSWGLTGSSNIPNYERFGTFSPLDNNVAYNGNPTIFPVRLANPNLSWETARTVDAGLEFGLLNDRLTGSISFYDRLSKDVLVNTATQQSTGFGRYYQNVGSVRNRGVEFEITSYNIDRNGFRWRTDFNIARNQNKVIDIGITAPDAIGGSGDTRVIPGYPVGVNYLVRVERIDDATGLPVFLDADGNETMTWSEDNRVPVGSVVPDAVGGITNTLSYKGFELKFLVTYSIGGSIYDDAAKRQLGVFTDWNMRTDIIERWNGPGSDATFSRLTLDPTTYGGMGSEWFFNTDQWLYDASFLRLKNVTFGYDVPMNSTSRFVPSKLRVYYTGTNLLTWTKYPGLDPEIVRDHDGPQARNISPNVTYLTPPQERTHSIGVTVVF